MPVRPIWEYRNLITKLSSVQQLRVQLFWNSALPQFGDELLWVIYISQCKKIHSEDSLRISDRALFKRFLKIAFLSLCLSSCLSVRIKLLDPHWTDLHKTWYLSIFQKLCSKNSNLIKIQQEHRLLYLTSYVHLWQYMIEYFLKWDVLKTKVADKIKKKHISYSITFSYNRAVYEIIWKKLGRAGETTDDNITERMRFACWIT